MYNNLVHFENNSCNKQYIFPINQWCFISINTATVAYCWDRQVRVYKQAMFLSEMVGRAGRPRSKERVRGLTAESSYRQSARPVYRRTLASFSVVSCVFGAGVVYLFMWVHGVGVGRVTRCRHDHLVHWRGAQWQQLWLLLEDSMQVSAQPTDG